MKGSESKTPKPSKDHPAKIIKDGMKMLEEFKQNPLGNILCAVLQDHVGTEREQKSALTGFLYILRILAMKDRSGILKITGKSSAGKTNLANTLLKLFPKEWIKEIGDSSAKAIRYLLWKDERILYIKEGSGSESSIETLKLMDGGDGGFKYLVTRGNVADGFNSEEIIVPVKFIITTSAKNIFDNELDNRMFGISIDEEEIQTLLILMHRCEFFAGHIPPPYFGIAKKFVLELAEFDEIIVPFAYEFLNIVKPSIRARRDIDKLLSLCQTSAFANQHNRPTVEYKGKKFLFATPEDAYNVFTLAFSSFEETTSGFTARMEKIYNAIPGDKSITYRDIMKETEFKHKMQVKREVEKLEDIGLIDIDTSSNKHVVCRVEDINKMKKDFSQHKTNFLLYTLVELAKFSCDKAIPLSWCDINDQINAQKNRNENSNETVTKLRNFYENGDFDKLLTDSNKIKVLHPIYGEVIANVKVLQQGENGIKMAKCNTVTKPTRADEKLPFFELKFNSELCGSRYAVTVEKNLSANSQETYENNDSSPKNNGELNFSEVDKDELIPKIVDIMKDKPAHEWKIDDICWRLNYADLQSRKRVGKVLRDVCSNPKSDTIITQLDEAGLLFGLKRVWNKASNNGEENDKEFDTSPDKRLPTSQEIELAEFYFDTDNLKDYYAAWGKNPKLSMEKFLEKCKEENTKK